METSKLTLSVKTNNIAKAKKYAQQNHTSVSKMFDEFIDKIVKEEVETEDPLLKRLKEMPIPEDIRKLTGILKGKFPPDVDTDAIKYEYLKEKYGL